MPNEIDGLTPIHTLKKIIQAEDYNRVRLALRRLRNPLRVVLHDLRHLEVILTDRSWLCIDTSFNDRPILAWADFQPVQPRTLHAPVNAVLHCYHAHAGLVMGDVLDALGVALEKQLHGHSRA